MGAVFVVLHARLLNETGEALRDLLGPLMYMIVLPYLGSRAASRELEKPTPAVPPKREARSALRNDDPFGGLNMRLTYRTIVVLSAVADHPGASNRKIADCSGVSDPGQISKLLGRLARLDLVKNHGERDGKGSPNAWELTQRGSQVARFARLR